MPARKIRWWNFWFNRFFIETAKNIKQPYLGHLTPEDRRRIHKIEKFALEGSLEDKLDFLGRVGKRFALVILDEKKSEDTGAAWISKLFRAFRSKVNFDKKGAYADLKNMGAFALTDVDFVKGVAHAADIYNSAKFNDISDFVGAHDTLFSFKTRMLDFKKHGQAITDIDQLIAAVMRIYSSDGELKAFKSAFQIDFNEYRMLVLLSARRSVKLTSLRDLFGATYFPKGIMDDLILKKLVQEDNVGMDKLYMMTGLGESMLDKARTYILDIVFKPQ